MNKVTSEQRIFAGVDGGGTSCRVRIEDEAGRLLGVATNGPAALRFGARPALDAIVTACVAALAEAGLPGEALGKIDVAIGIAGIGRKRALEAIVALPNPFR